MNVFFTFVLDYIEFVGVMLSGIFITCSGCFLDYVNRKSKRMMSCFWSA